MITFTKGNLFESNADALVNTVNTEGVMGKGIALQFKKQFPNNYKAYRALCKERKFNIGDLFFFEEANFATGNKWIINFPTKTTWRKPSQYSFIDAGLDTLVKEIEKYPIKSIAIPPLGSGNGGLDWNIVKQKIIQKLQGLNIDITVYEPNTQVKELMRQERVKLTPARAMLLFMLYKLVKNGEFVSEFSSEKLCYFLQRFGARQYFNLTYKPNFYGPYSGVVKRVLNHLNGSYIMGYGGMDKKPFEFLSLVADGEPMVNSYLNEHPELLEIAKKTDAFLTGFYSDFSLELLSTVDFISQTKQTLNKTEILNELLNWNDRKRTMFSNEKFIDVSIAHLKKADFKEV
ncbi:macro domain-containing protein [Xanthomarina gelatinilytica]|uniref:type II toxin-antitoxin system antitoxin DNA ADP-ribosyl glycohydrolase DarG n=1 Tax=Xanthomarina gelatinilytica TaxID=1137281 RepID=UPI003AA8AE19